MKNILYVIAALLLIAACYYGYDWLISEPDNKEPLPALLSFLSSIVSLIIAWIIDSKSQESDKDIDVSNIKDEGRVDIDEKEKDKSSIRVKNVKGKAKVFINKGKETLNN